LIFYFDNICKLASLASASRLHDTV